MKIINGLLMATLGVYAQSSYAVCSMNGNQIICSNADFDGVPTLNYDGFDVLIESDALVTNSDNLGFSPFGKFSNSSFLIEENAMVTVANNNVNDGIPIFSLLNENLIINHGKILAPNTVSDLSLLKIDSQNCFLNESTGYIEINKFGGKVFDLSGTDNMLINQGVIHLKSSGSKILVANEFDNKNSFYNGSNGEIISDGDFSKLFEINNGLIANFTNAGKITVSGDSANLYKYYGSNASSTSKHTYGTQNENETLVGGIYNTGEIIISGKGSSGFMMVGNDNDFYNIAGGLIQTTNEAGKNWLVYSHGDNNILHNIDASMILNAGDIEGVGKSYIFRVSGENNEVINDGFLQSNAEYTSIVSMSGDGNKFHNKHDGFIQLNENFSIGIASFDSSLENNKSGIYNQNIMQSNGSATILIYADNDHSIVNAGLIESNSVDGGLSIGIIVDGTEKGNRVTNNVAIKAISGVYNYGIVANQNNEVWNNGLIQINGNHSQAIQLHYDGLVENLVDEFFTDFVEKNSGSNNIVYNKPGAVIAVGSEQGDGFIAARAIFGLGENNQVENNGTIFVNGKPNGDEDLAGAILLMKGEYDDGSNNQVYNREMGVIKAIGDQPFAVYLHGVSGLSIKNYGVVTTTGNLAQTIKIKTETNPSIINHQEISAFGEQAISINLLSELGAKIVNSGIIFAEGTASQAIKLTSINDSLITNNGFIGSDSQETIAINWQDSAASSVNKFYNAESGSIRATAFSLLGSQGREEIINHGSIEGDIDLAAGDDLFVLGLKAVLPEYVQGGEGSDQFILEGSVGNYSAQLALNKIDGFEKLDIGFDENGQLVVDNQSQWSLSGVGDFSMTRFSSGSLELNDDVTLLGDYQQSTGTTLYVDLYEDGSSETLFVSGLADLQGGHLILQPQVLLPEKTNMQWTIVSASEVIGEFETVNQLFALVELVQENNGTELNVVTRQVQAFANPLDNELTPNQLEVAKSFDRLVVLGVEQFTDMYDLLVDVQSTDATKYQGYLDQFHGEVYQNIMLSAVVEQQNQLQKNMRKISDISLQCRIGNCQEGVNIYVDTTTENTQRDDVFQNEFASYDIKQNSMHAGLVSSIGSSHVGLELSYSDNEFDDYQNSHGGDADAENQRVGATIFSHFPVKLAALHLDLRTSMNVMHNDIDVERQFALTNQAREITGSTDAWTYGGRIDIAHLLSLTETAYLELSGGMDYLRYESESFTEEGGQDVGLYVNDFSDEQARVIAGAKLGWYGVKLDELTISPSIGIAYAHSVTDDEFSNEQCFAGEAAKEVCFTNYAVAPESQALVDLAINGSLGAFSFGVSANMSKSIKDQGVDAYGVQGRIGYQF